MESIGAYDAKTRLSELLDRAAQGEAFLITKHGRPVARLMPERGHDRERARRAAERLKQMRGAIPNMTTDQMVEMIHEGHRY